MKRVLKFHGKPKPQPKFFWSLCSVDAGDSQISINTRLNVVGVIYDVTASIDGSGAICLIDAGDLFEERTVYAGEAECPVCRKMIPMYAEAAEWVERNDHTWKII